jgi:hypothetical protein
MMSAPLVNKVAQKAIVTLDLETYLPAPDAVAVVDLKEFLFKGLILREADFREQVEKTDWQAYQGKYVTIHCSADAIIPMWAYMVLSASLAPYAKDIVAGDMNKAMQQLLLNNLAALDAAPFEGARVVIKGCGDREVDNAAFIAITKKLAGTAKAIMYGEPCSTVPIWRKIAD